MKINEDKLIQKNINEDEDEIKMEFKLNQKVINDENNKISNNNINKIIRDFNRDFFNIYSENLEKLNHLKKFYKYNSYNLRNIFLYFDRIKFILKNEKNLFFFESNLKKKIHLIETKNIDFEFKKKKEMKIQKFKNQIEKLKKRTKNNKNKIKKIEKKINKIEKESFNIKKKKKIKKLINKEINDLNNIIYTKIKKIKIYYNEKWKIKACKK
jgi:hypothetical protein